MERKGNEISVAVSGNGQDWKVLNPRVLPDTWPAELYVGVAAITTSKEEFAPIFSELKRE